MTPFEKFKKDFQGKKVLIFGLGLQGRGAEDAKIFAGVDAKVTVTDQKPKEDLEPSLEKLKSLNLSFTLGEHDSKDVTNSDVIIRNASVPWNHPLLELARNHKIPIHMDAALFFRYAHPNAVGVTGTRGKSTTTTLIHQILASSLPHTTLAGNLVPRASLSFLESHQPNNLYIFELSSWQLQAFHQQKISPKVAVVTNIYPDHLLDRSFNDYLHDKKAIFAYQNKSDLLILNQEDNKSQELAKEAKGKVAYFNSSQVPTQWKLKLKGQHNLENIAAALKVADHFNIDSNKARTIVENFPTLPYRLEETATINKVAIVNDTTSTTPTATIKALQTYPNSVLILGGTSKSLPTRQLIKTVNTNSSAIVLLSGSGTQEIKPHLDKTKLAGEFNDLKQAINLALSLAKPGQTILFSPGFTSFGMFTNEFDRGVKFNQIVTNIAKQTR